MLLYYELFSKSIYSINIIMKNFLILILLLPLFSCASTVNFPNVIAKTTPSVVHIMNILSSDSESDTKLEDHNGKPIMTGSGFMISGNHIITNQHVIENSSELLISFKDDPKSYPASIIGFDKEIDIAVLKFNGDKTVNPLSWSEQEIRSGQDIWVYGHPAGLLYSVSKGIISHTDRRITNPWQRTIQVDAAINSGNSGGPLFDMNGDVVGINVMLVSPTKAFAGIGLAIDGEIAQRAINDILADGKIIRPLMGVILEYDRELFVVKASELSPDGAAKTAGMMKDDIYVTIDNMPIKYMEDVFDVLAMKKPNDIIAVEIKRGNETKIIQVKLGALPNE